MITSRSPAQRGSWAAATRSSTPPAISAIRDLGMLTVEDRAVGSLRALLEAFAGALAPAGNGREIEPRLWLLLDQATQTSKRNRSALMEIAVTRYVDSFLVYVSELISLLFRQRPECLKSSEQVPLEDVLRHNTLDEFVAWQVDERVNRLSYKVFDEIQKYVYSRFGFLLVEKDTELERNLLRAIATRNLPVHRRGVVDERYIYSACTRGIPRWRHRRRNAVVRPNISFP
jgi:hypothetical protein